MGYGPPQVVESQPRQALPYGLFSVLDFRNASDPHWANGIEWESMTCAPASGIEDPDCETFLPEDEGGGGFEKFFTSVVRGSAVGFTVYGSDTCGIPGASAFRDAEENATAHLLTREEGQAEAAVWRRLASQATDVHPSGAVSPSRALGLLEKWMGGVYGSLGVIHADREAATMLDTHLEREGSRLVTEIGTPFVAGGGYPGTSPAGAATPDVAWMFASPALFGYRGEVFSERVIDQRNNDVYALAERQYVVGFDPCGVAAVRMTLA